MNALLDVATRDKNIPSNEWHGKLRPWNHNNFIKKSIMHIVNWKSSKQYQDFVRFFSTIFVYSKEEETKNRWNAIAWAGNNWIWLFVFNRINVTDRFVCLCDFHTHSVSHKRYFIHVSLLLCKTMNFIILQVKRTAFSI